MTRRIFRNLCTLTGLLFCLVVPPPVFGQGGLKISGTIKDKANGEDLVGATVAIKEMPGKGAVSNAYGFYSLSLPAGKYTLIYGFVGYDPIMREIDGSGEQKINIELAENAQELDVIVVSAEAEDANVTANEMSVVKLSPKEIEDVPVLFGERDIMKTIQLMPGVQSAGEGGSGFYVRGGDAGQNLLLLDEAPVYNASHMMGFFSVFNSDAIRSVDLYKAGIPPAFGGRVSSVMDIKMKEGDSKNFGVSGGIGLIASRLTAEGPIVKDKGSFIISGRRTYADMFLAFSSDEDLNNSSLYFYDLNMKANYSLNDNNRLFVSGYFGKDKMGTDDFGIDWGNATGTVRWNHILNSSWFSNTSLIYSKYRFGFEISDNGAAKRGLDSNIENWNLKQQFEYYRSENISYKFGLNAIRHTVSPGEMSADDEAAVSDFSVPKRHAFEYAAYASADHKISPKFRAEYGLRFSGFLALGPGDFHTYNDKGDIISTETYDKNEVAEDYYGLEPRLNLTYLLDGRSSFKFSYNRVYQYLHLLSASSSGTPMDYWMPSSNNIEPEIGDQWAVGYFRNFNENQYEFSAEVYYKDIQNVLDYKVGADVILNENVEADLLYGDGRAYGLELHLKKKTGKLTGWLSYTLSRSERKFDELNNNDWFPAKQDRTHDISITAVYKLSERVKLSGNWVFYTGNAVTFPSGKYQVDGKWVNLYTERNGYRMPDYHRLDLGLTLENKKYKYTLDRETGKKVKVKKKVESGWNFSLYNAYARENAYTITFRENEDDRNQTEAVRLALFSIIPSVSYYFKF
ncbi:collagen-binding protein (plasmid) [Fulvitalea axinellae]|uniref:Collagen-binding protein n=1 Tax=Fulvitalea axinellae TaxID=1182444 RepID=A0AAU9DAL7_9BACT|nr:collagen-binding protein [Fulvitalea axinellae]